MAMQRPVAAKPLVPVAPAAPVPALARIEAHYRKFLTTRWAGLVIRAAVVTSMSFTFVPFFLISANYSFLSLIGSLLILGPILYLFSVHLVLRARREWAISPPVLPSQPSKAAVLLGAFSLPTYGLYAAYVALGIVVALLYSWSMNLRNPDSALGWFSSTPRHPWHGNERLWFLVLGNTLFFWSLAVRDVLKVTFLPKWPRALVRFPVAVRSSLVACFTTYSGPISFVGDASLALTFTLAYSFVYFATRRTTWSWAMTYVPVLRPFIINFVKRSNLTWSMAWHLLVLQLTALLALKPALAVLNDYITQPLHFASFTSRSPLTPDRYLLTALETKNAFYLDHTIMELQRAVHSPARRAAIFADSSNPTLVHELFAALLLQLGNVHATLTSRGAAQGPSTPKPAPKPAAPDAHSMALKTADIFRPAPKKTGLQQIVGHVLEGTPQPTPAPVVAIAASASRAEAEVRRRVEEPAHAIERWAAGTPVLGPIVGAVTLARGGFARWAAGEWTRRRVFAAVPEQDRLERLVDILATLVVASADEDKYGFVQAVLPATLEALVRVRVAALALGAELAPIASKVAPEAADDVRAQTAGVADTIAVGVYRIVDRFGRSLQAFRFPTHVAAQLTEMCKA